MRVKAAGCENGPLGMGQGMRLTLYVTLLLVVVCLPGCVGSPVHATFQHGSLQSKIKKNNAHLMDLSIGMDQGQVKQIMGDPEQSEGYKWGSAWLYRTAMTTGIYGTGDSDFTPVVFDEHGRVVGWGRNFFSEHVKRYELTVKRE